MTYEDHGEVTLARLDLASAQLTPLMTTGHSAAPDVARDGKFMVFYDTQAAPAELFRLDLAATKGTAPTQLTHMNREALKDVEFGEVS